LGFLFGAGSLLRQRTLSDDLRDRRSVRNRVVSQSLLRQRTLSDGRELGRGLDHFRGLNRFFASEPFPTVVSRIFGDPPVCSLNRFFASEPFPTLAAPASSVTVSLRLNRFFASEPFPTNAQSNSQATGGQGLNRFFASELFPTTGHRGWRASSTSPSQSLLRQRTLSDPPACTLWR